MGKDRGDIKTIKIIESLDLYQREALENILKFPYNYVERHAITFKTKKHYRIGVISDTHLNSRYERVEFLHFLYEQFERECIDFVLHCGDITDGFRKSSEHERQMKHLHPESILEHVLENYPKTDKFKTLFISGAHDRTFLTKPEKKDRFDICGEIHARREDLFYLCSSGSSYFRADVKVGATLVRIKYNLESKAYTISNPLQKIIKHMSEGEKPDILIIGGTHAVYDKKMRDVYGFLPGALQAQTPIMETRGIRSILRGTIMDLYFDKEGKLSGAPEYTSIPPPYYDKPLKNE